MTRTLADPPLRADGLCAECLRERKHAKPNRYSKDQPVYDPFCSTECCKAWHARARERLRAGGA